MVLARAWEILLAPLGLSVAVRLNLLSAFTSAAAHGLWFLVVHHILGYFGKDRSFRIIGALVAVLISATAFTVWSQSNVNEKVYTVALFTIALLTWLLFRWQARVEEGRVPMGGPHARAGAVRSDNLLVLMAFYPRLERRQPPDGLPRCTGHCGLHPDRSPTDDPELEALPGGRGRSGGRPFHSPVPAGAGCAGSRDQPERPHLYGHRQRSEGDRQLREVRLREPRRVAHAGPVRDAGSL